MRNVNLIFSETTVSIYLDRSVPADHCGVGAFVRLQGEHRRVSSANSDKIRCEMTYTAKLINYLLKMATSGVQIFLGSTVMLAVLKYILVAYDPRLLKIYFT